MRLTLFEAAGIRWFLPLEIVRHILPQPKVFPLPLLRPCFSGVLLYGGQIVPLLLLPLEEGGAMLKAPDFVLVCDTGIGPVGVPADRVERITTDGEIASDVVASIDSGCDMCEIGGWRCRPLSLNRVLEASESSA